MKKLLVLAMSCEQDFFKKEEEIIKTYSYAKKILEKKYDNVDFWSYSASSDGKIHVDKNKHRITVPVDDSLYGTYIKTVMTLKVINSMNIEYDYIFRTNCSTWINVPLLKQFVEEIPKNHMNIIYSSSIYSTKDASGPEIFDLYAVGNSMLIPKYWCDILITNTVYAYKQYDKTVSDKLDDKKSIYNIDDNAIGFIVNTYCDLNDIDKHGVWMNFKQKENILDVSDFQDYIAIPVRIYDNDVSRELEFNALTNLSSIEKDIVYNNVYDEQIKNQCVKLIDFSKSFGYNITKEQYLNFINNYSDDVVEYCKKLIK